MSSSRFDLEATSVGNGAYNQSPAAEERAELTSDLLVPPLAKRCEDPSRHGQTLTAKYEQRALEKLCRRLFPIAAILAIAGALGSARLDAKSTNDVVVMKNGDTFTGEIKKLENGVLYLKANYMVDPVQLDWAQVERVQSNDRFNVLFSSGQLVIGKIETEQANQDTRGDFAVQSGGAEIRARKSEVARMAPVEDRFWAQLTGSIDYGFSFTGGSDTIESSLSGSVEYRTEGWAVRMNGSSVLNRESGAKRSGRNTLDFLDAKYLGTHWYAGVTASLLNSNQQDLTLRTSGGGGIGRDFVRSGTASLSVLGAVVYSGKNTLSTSANSRIKTRQRRCSGYFFQSTRSRSCSSLETWWHTRTSARRDACD